MKILKEDATTSKESIPVSFLTDLVSKSWDEVGYLKDAAAAIRDEFKDTTQVETLMQNLMDAYLIFIGQLESYLHTEEDLVVNDIEATEVVEPAVDAPELPDVEIETNALAIEEKPISSETPVHIATSGDFDNYKVSDEVIAAKRTESPADDFEFFVNFDEPDMAEPKLTDDDLYGHEDSEFENNKLKSQLFD